MIEWTDEQRDTIKALDKFISDTSDSGYDRPFVINGSAGTGKSFLISNYFQSRNMKYLVTTLSGKASNVLSRRGIPSETIHHCLYLPTDLNTWLGFMGKINYGLIECNGDIVENPDWNGQDINTQYMLKYVGDRDVLYYMYKDVDGKEKEQEVSSEIDVPEGYECLSRHEQGVEQTIIGCKDMFREWDIHNSIDVKQFLDLQHIIGFEDLRDESEGGSWLFKLRAERLFNMQSLIIDEYGMVPPDMMKQLIKTCKEMQVKLILSGDEAQLKPISISKPIHFDADSTLTQIMRQSSDNPILQFATLIRLYGVKVAIEHMAQNQSNRFVIVNEEDVSDEFLRQYKKMDSQVICGLNRTRKWLNKRIKGNTKLEVGDKIIIVDINDWDYAIDKSQCLTNGTQGIVRELYDPQYYFYPEYRPNVDDNGEFDYEHPVKITKPSNYDLAHDYRLSNYICKVDFESTDGDHIVDNRNMKTLPIAISRAVDDERFEDYQYLPKNSYYGYTKNGLPRKVSLKDKLKYSYDHIVEYFEGSNREENQIPKHINDEITAPYKKAYTDYYSCPDYRKKKRSMKIDGGKELCVYSTERTKPYYLNSHIAEHGYAISGHKSQGSEYNDIMIWFEPFGNQSDIRHWLYTSITRGKESLVLVLTKTARDMLGYDLKYD